MTIAPSRQFVIVALVTVAGWAVFTYAANANQVRMTFCGIDSGYDGPRCNFQSIARRYPYCTVDPVCISPMATDATKYGYGYGLDNVGDPGVVATPALMLAAPNLLLFIACFGIVALLATGLAPEVWKRPLLVVIMTWYVLELCRWGEAIWRFAQSGYGNRLLSQPATYLVLAGVLLPLGVCIMVLRWTLSTASHRGLYLLETGRQ